MGVKTRLGARNARLVLEKHDWGGRNAQVGFEIRGWGVKMQLGFEIRYIGGLTRHTEILNSA